MKPTPARRIRKLVISWFHRPVRQGLRVEVQARLDGLMNFGLSHHASQLKVTDSSKGHHLDVADSATAGTGSGGRDRPRVRDHYSLRTTTALSLISVAAAPAPEFPATRPQLHPNASVFEFVGIQRQYRY